MREPRLTSPLHEESLWRDTAIVIGITVISIILSAHFNLNEALYSLTRREERFQIDELQIGMLCC